MGGPSRKQIPLLIPATLCPLLSILVQSQNVPPPPNVGSSRGALVQVPAIICSFNPCPPAPPILPVPGPAQTLAPQAGPSQLELEGAPLELYYPSAALAPPAQATTPPATPTLIAQQEPVNIVPSAVQQSSPPLAAAQSPNNPAAATSPAIQQNLLLGGVNSPYIARPLTVGFVRLPFTGGDIPPAPVVEAEPLPTAAPVMPNVAGLPPVPLPPAATLASFLFDPPAPSPMAPLPAPLPSSYLSLQMPTPVRSLAPASPVVPPPTRPLLLQDFFPPVQQQEIVEFEPPLPPPPAVSPVPSPLCPKGWLSVAASSGPFGLCLPAAPASVLPASVTSVAVDVNNGGAQAIGPAALPSRLPVAYSQPAGMFGGGRGAVGVRNNNYYKKYGTNWRPSATEEQQKQKLAVEISGPKAAEQRKKRK